MLIETISVSDLSRIHVGLGAASASVPVRDAVPSSAPSALTVIGPANSRIELKAVNEAQATVNALGCYFIRDIMVCGPGYVFHGDKLLTDGSHLSQVA